MRKTFLKVALIGLLVGSLPVGFTSCKDYDDDISNLENKNQSLEQQLQTVNTTIAGLATKSDLTAAQAAAVAQAKADLEAVKAQLEAAIANKADQSAVNDINTKLAGIQGQLETIEALKVTIADELTAIKAAIANKAESADVQAAMDAATKNGQAIAGLEAEIAELTKGNTENATAVADLVEQLAALKTELTDNQTAAVAELNAKIADLAKQIEAAGGETGPINAAYRVMNGMITSVRIVSDWSNNVLSMFNPVEAKETPVGPKGEALRFNLKKGDVKEFTDSILLQVSPSNAVLTKEDLSLINSQKGNVDEFVTISEVKPYEGLLTSRAVTENGLFAVYFKQNPKYIPADDVKDEKGLTRFAKATIKDGKAIRFAIAVADQIDNAEDAESRYVMTPYDLTISTGSPAVMSNINFDVDETNVTAIHNRFLYAADNSSFMYKAFSGYKTDMKGVYADAKAYANYNAAKNQGYAPVGDFHWSDNKMTQATFWGDGEKVAGDNRTSMPYYAVETGKDFVVTLKGNYDIAGWYVDIDTYRATESGESEIAAWTKYAENIAGIDSVYVGNQITLNIAEAAKVPTGDVIGFRVWAVNYNGKLADPDGRAFYVQVNGEEPAVTTDDIVATFTAVQTGAPAAFKYGNYTEILDWITGYESVDVYFVMNDNESEVGANKNKKAFNAGSDSKVTFTSAIGSATVALDGEETLVATVGSKNYAKIFQNIYVSINNNKFADGQYYEGAINIYSKGNNPQLLQSIPVWIQKNLPDVIGQNFKPAAGIIDASGAICIFANNGDVANPSAISDWVTASMANVFTVGVNNSFISLVGSEGYNFAMKVKDGEPGVFGEEDTNDLYIGRVNGNEFYFAGISTSSSEQSKTYTINEKATQILNPYATDGSYILTAADEMPTLDIVNGKAHKLIIWKNYNNTSWYPTFDKDNNVVKTAAEVGLTNNIVSDNSYSVKVQTYPNTYNAAINADVTLKFKEAAIVAQSAVTLSSTWTNFVTNESVPTLLSWATGNNYAYSISRATYSLTGNVAEYYKQPVIAPVTISINANGKVVKTDDNTPVYGVAVRSYVSNGKTYYAWADGDTNASKTISGVIIRPTDNVVNAPSANLTGALTVYYYDAFGLGEGFRANGTVIPHSTSAPVNMINAAN